MKNRTLSFISVVLAAMAAVCVSCSKEDPNKLSFDTENVYVMPNEYAFANASFVTPSEGEVISYSVSNPAIATVSAVDGVCRIDGVTAGSTMVTASCNGKTAVCNVIVMTEEQLQQYLPAERNTSIGKFIKVSPGSFRMGSDNGQANEAPVHLVTISKAFYLAQYELTQDVWESVMGSNPSEDKGEKLPVNKVSNTDINSFITKLSADKGYACRLPTEAEWEYAARGGDKSNGYLYSGSNELSDVAWYDGNEGVTPHEVGTKAANELGLYDMSGNILEMCSDKQSAYTSSSVVDPVGAGTRFCVRGGKFDSEASECTVSHRLSVYNTDKYYNMGCRLVLE